MGAWVLIIIMSRVYDEMVKIMLIGDSNVGKTSIMRKFCKPEASDLESIPSSVGLDYAERIISIQGKNVLVQIWDTAGQEKFQTLTPSYYRSAMGILLVFSVTDKSSFNSVELWMRQIKQYAVEDIPVIILCNKIDINSKEVSDVQLKALEKRHAINTIYTSAFKNINITESVVALYNKVSEEKKVKHTNNSSLHLITHP
jgi:small GTP-binding protein